MLPILNLKRAIRTGLITMHLFMAAKEYHGGVQWTEWDKDLILRKPAALKAVGSKAVRSDQFSEIYTVSHSLSNGRMLRNMRTARE